jgi:divinyl chlorophyllide a 8-vinyl-reductase
VILTRSLALQPISEPDLASYMADCIRDPKLWDRVLPIGGPGEALSALQQGEMLFDILGQKPRFIQVPVALFDAIIGFLDFLASIFSNMKDTAEFGRIGKYYAVESMLVMDPVTGRYDANATPSYGKDTLRCVRVRQCVRVWPAYNARLAGASSSALRRTAWLAKSLATRRCSSDERRVSINKFRARL